MLSSVFAERDVVVNVLQYGTSISVPLTSRLARAMFVMWKWDGCSGSVQIYGYMVQAT